MKTPFMSIHLRHVRNFGGFDHSRSCRRRIAGALRENRDAPLPHGFGPYFCHRGFRIPPIGSPTDISDLKPGFRLGRYVIPLIAAIAGLSLATRFYYTSEFGDIGAYPDSALVQLQRGVFLEAKRDFKGALAAYEQASKACQAAGTPRSSESFLKLMYRQADLLEKLGDPERAAQKLFEIWRDLDSRFMTFDVLANEPPEARERRWKQQFTVGVRMAELLQGIDVPPTYAASIAGWIQMVLNSAWPPFWDPRKTVDHPPTVSDIMHPNGNVPQVGKATRPSWITAYESSLAAETTGLLLIKLASVRDDYPPSIYEQRGFMEEGIIARGYSDGMRLLWSALDWANRHDKSAVCRRATLTNNIANAIYKQALRKKDVEGAAKAAIMAKEADLEAAKELGDTLLTSPVEPNLTGKVTDYTTDIGMARRWADGARTLAASKPKDAACRECLRAAIFNHGVLLEEQGWLRQAEDDYREVMKLAREDKDWTSLESAAAALKAVESLQGKWTAANSDPASENAPNK